MKNVLYLAAQIIITTAIYLLASLVVHVPVALLFAACVLIIFKNASGKDQKEKSDLTTTIVSRKTTMIVLACVIVPVVTLFLLGIFVHP